MVGRGSRRAFEGIGGGRRELGGLRKGRRRLRTAGGFGALFGGWWRIEVDIV